MKLLFKTVTGWISLKHFAVIYPEAGIQTSVSNCGDKRAELRKLSGV